MGAPNCCKARSTISIARSTPAQKPRGWANRISLSITISLKHGNKVHFKLQGLPGQGMIKVKQSRYFAQFTQDAGKAAAAWRGKVHQVTNFVIGARHRIFIERG